MPNPDRIGVFGGTFDPPHVGHMVAAVNVAFQLRLDHVLFVVANVPWQKTGSREISSATDRLAMVRLAAEDRAEFSASTIEIDNGGDSVTAATLHELRELHPTAEFELILGSDAAVGLATWRRGDEIPQLASIAIVDRPGTSGQRPPAPFEYKVVACPLMDVSSTDIRHRVESSLPIDYLVPDGTTRYIDEKGLYR